jgi:hypothetical protein
MSLISLKKEEEVGEVFLTTNLAICSQNLLTLSLTLNYVTLEFEEGMCPLGH